MKNLKTITAVAIASVTLLVACKKNGQGGKATLVAMPEHHGKTIYGATAYIKFGTKEAPTEPTKNYDLKLVGEPKEDHVHIEEMRQGSYYMYVTGYDSAIKQVVFGGVPVNISYGQRKKEIDLKVPVSE
jgi:hypothetical protein